MRQAVEVLCDAAAAGDVAAAKLLIPYLNQGYGMPQEKVTFDVPQTAQEVASLPAAELLRLVESGE